MGGLAENILTTILGVEFIIGNLGNGFIALVNCVDWFRRRKILPVDQILTALAVSRIGMLWLVLLTWCVHMYFLGLLKTGEMLKIVYFPLKVSSHLSIWLATCLIIFYFLKIANFSNSIFLYLKWRVNMVIFVTLMMSLILLFLNIILMNTHIDLWIGGFTGNVSDRSSVRMFVQFSKLLLLDSTVFMFIPFTVSLTAFLLLISSLWRHLRTMQSSAPGCRDSRTTAHVKALQSVVTFLLLYTIFFMSFLGKIWSLELVVQNPIVSFVWATEMTFPSVHSYVLILGDRKLRQAFLLVLWWLRGRSKDAGP